MGLEIKSFDGVTYNVEKFGYDWSNLTCPPYDVITEAEREKLLSLSPYNYVNIILHKPLSKVILQKQERDYEAVRVLIDSWKQKGVFSRSVQNNIYLYKQDYRFDGRDRNRYGFVSLVRLPEESGVILPHENTHKGPKEDRFDLLSKVKAILEPVFFLIPDDEGELLNHLKFGWSTVKDKVIAKDSMGTHYCAGTSDEGWIEKLQALLYDSKALIADGHHRYEVGLQYRDFMRRQACYDPEAWYNYIMVFFVPMHGENITILPIYRRVNKFFVKNAEELLKKVDKFFNVYPCTEQTLKSIALGKDDFYVYGIVTKFGSFKLELKSDINPEKVLADMDGHSSLYKKLHVVVLHKILFPLLDIDENEGSLFYEKELGEALKPVDESASFILRPTSLRHVYDLALNGERMPQKSTYFYPKIRSGFVFFDSL